MAQAIRITVGATANVLVAKVWKAWNTPDDIIQWNTPDSGWHTPSSENNLTVGGKFKYRMEAKDGSFGFDFEGIYDEVELHKEIAYTLGDERKVITLFAEQDGKTTI
ncbi:SRPBCC domain-containing protein [Pedobacter sp. NJ-S-72]